jgi:hypothetical protein
MSYQIRVKYPFFGGDKADGRWQMAEGKKDFSRKGGYQGGFGISLPTRKRLRGKGEKAFLLPFPL